MTNTCDEVTYICGGCNFTSTDAGNLHLHLQAHEEGGSFYYNHLLRTAFPRYDSTCKEVQTDIPSPELNQTQVEVISSEHILKSNLLNTYPVPLQELSKAEIISDDDKLNMKIKTTEKEHEAFVVGQNSFQMDHSYLFHDKFPGVGDGFINSKGTNTVYSISDSGEVVERTDQEYDVAETLENRDGNCSIERNTQENIAETFKKVKSTGSYECAACFKKYRSQQNLRSHMVKCDKRGSPVPSEKSDGPAVQEWDKQGQMCEGTFRCKQFVGDKAVFNSQQLHDNRVKSSHSNGSPDQCQFCSMQLVSETQKEKHMETHMSGETVKSEGNEIDFSNSFHCLLCDKKFDYKRNLTRHVATCHRDSYPIFCNTCCYAFADESDLMKHKCNKVSEQNHKCLQCKDLKPFTHKASLVKHLKYEHKGEYPLSCPECKKPLASVVDKNKHMLKHAGKTLHACTVCKKTFNSHHSLDCHMKCHEKVTKKHNDPFVESKLDSTSKENCNFECLVCDKRYTFKRDLKRHISSNHITDYPVRCSECAMPFIKFEDLDKHKCDTLKVHDCIQCDGNVTFLQKFGLMKHIRDIHNGEFPLTCEVCDKHLVSELDKRKHMRQHSEPKHTCNICLKTLHSAYSLSIHMMVHGNEKPHKCSLCEKSYRTTTQLKYHTQADHSNEKKEICHLCGQGFNSRKQMCKHIRSCFRQFSCPVCESRFPERYKLKMHMLIHTGEKPYMCDKCGFTSAHGSVLKRHMMHVHTKKKGYICNKCDKGFVTKDSLARHERVHMKLRPHVCSHCNKAFSERWNLKAHERQHTGEKPYKCETCSKSFTHNVLRKTHQRKCFGQPQSSDGLSLRYISVADVGVSQDVLTFDEF